MRCNKISVARFTDAAFREAVLRAAGATESRGAFPQLDYLQSYCGTKLKAASFVTEEFYIDRHYMDEHNGYYARSLELPNHHVARIHLFEEEVSAEMLDGAFEECAMAKEWGRDSLRLRTSYLGFVCVRPIPAAPIGRTILKRLSDDESRSIWAVGAHHVHLGNLPLCVVGIPFQQQDLAVGSCATAATWTALAQVARRDGTRSPTPREVSEAAGRHLLDTGRTMPANDGLSPAQLCEAVRSMDFAPQLMLSSMPAEKLLLALHTYLRSGIPVVLALQGEGRAFHAVAAVGFQCSEKPEEWNRLAETTVPAQSVRVKKLYVHDDLLGPYARAELRLSSGLRAPLVLVIRQDFEPNEKRVYDVKAALAPLYPKIRLSPEDLVRLSDGVMYCLECAAGERRVELSVEYVFWHSGDFLRSLRGGRSVSEFVKTVALPRWVAVGRWYIGDDLFVDFLYDTTMIFPRSPDPDVQPSTAGDLTAALQALRSNAQTAGAALVRGVVSYTEGRRVQVCEISGALGNVPLCEASGSSLTISPDC